MKSRGFTLIELLVVIAIIGIIATVVLVGLSNAREKANIAKTVITVKQVKTSLNLYFSDVGHLPATCRKVLPNTCTAASDPFVNSLGETGWGGPYYSFYDKTTPWGGDFSFFSGLDLENNGTLDYGLILDDDRPGYTFTDNGGAIPEDTLQQLDRILDDGNLQTGNARGGSHPPASGHFWPNPAVTCGTDGELCIRLHPEI